MLAALPLRHAGDIHRYDELCTKHAAMLNGQPALVAHERRLREKITILCLMVSAVVVVVGCLGCWEGGRLDASFITSSLACWV